MGVVGCDSPLRVCMGCVNVVATPPKGIFQTLMCPLSQATDNTTLDTVSRVVTCNNAVVVKRIKCQVCDIGTVLQYLCF